MDKELLKEFVQENPNLVSMKPAGDGIYVLKYKKRVFYDNLWNDYLEECRGTIVDSDFNVVQRPFTKIYNYGVEAKAPVLAPDTKVTAHRKVNGFMLAMTWHDGKLLVSTTGSTDSDYVAMARELFDEALYADTFRVMKDFTFMFEVVHKNDPHIIPEREGLYLLVFRHKAWYGKVFADAHTLHPLGDSLGCHRVEICKTTVGELVEEVKKVKHEGFVFYTEDGISAKLKSPYYLTSKWVARNPRTDKLVNMQADIKQNLDEEYYPLVDAIRANIVEYTAMDEQARLAWVREQLAG